MNIQTLKGFRDFLPNEARKRQYVLDILRNVFESYGFEPLETPALEYEEILTGKYGDEGEKLMYKFEDRGGRKVAMRYDQTVPLARVVAQYQNDLPLPFKRYQIQNVWRAENTQKGRYREFLQIDIDTVGSSSLLADTEVIEIAIKSFIALGFQNFKALINDREIFQNLVSSKLVPPESLIQVLRAVDKLSKIGDGGVLKELESIGIPKDKRNLILDAITNQRLSENLEKIFKSLKKAGIDEKYFEFSPALARGLDYYTSAIFEVIGDDYEGSALGGGGRYDNLVGMFAQRPIPAVGFSFGFDRLIEAMDELNLFDGKDLGGTKILVTNTSDQAPDIANRLRGQEISVEFYADEKDLDKQLKYADKKRIPYVLIFDGPKLLLKNMVSGDQKEVTIESLPDAIR